MLVVTGSETDAAPMELPGKGSNKNTNNSDKDMNTCEEWEWQGQQGQKQPEEEQKEAIGYKGDLYLNYKTATNRYLAFSLIVSH